MAEQNIKTWREQRKTLLPDMPETVYFDDTKPNYIMVNNNGATPLYMGISSIASPSTYDVMIPGYGSKLHPRMSGTDRIYLYSAAKEPVSIQITSWEGEFNPASVPQSQEVVAGGADGLLGIVDIGNFLVPLPAGNNLIGSVMLDKFTSPLPTGDNKIGQVGISQFHSALPQGDNIIGRVKVAEAVTLASGVNNIGKVDINSLPIQYGDYKKVTAAAAGEVEVKNGLGYVYQIVVEGATTVQLMDGTNEAWKLGDFSSNIPIRCLTSIKLKFSGAGTAYILYA